MPFTSGVFTCHASSGWLNMYAFLNALAKVVHPETSQLFKGLLNTSASSNVDIIDVIGPHVLTSPLKPCAL